MALDTIVRGSTSGLGAEVTSSNELKVKLSATDGGAVRLFSENDPGAKTGTAYQEDDAESLMLLL